MELRRRNERSALRRNLLLLLLLLLLLARDFRLFLKGEHQILDGQQQFSDQSWIWQTAFSRPKSIANFKAYILKTRQAMYILCIVVCIVVGLKRAKFEIISKWASVFRALLAQVLVGHSIGLRQFLFLTILWSYQKFKIDFHPYKF